MNTQSEAAAKEIDAIIAKYPDWRGERMTQIRNLIQEADPEITVEAKYKKPSDPDGIPVWYHDGMICTGETYKQHMRIGFAKGPDLKDPKGLLNSYRAVIIKEEDTINEDAFKDLVKEAVKLNQEKKAKK